MKKEFQKQHVILVVDDDPEVKDLTRDIFELKGHRVLTAANGGEALKLCDRWGKEISLVFLDLSSCRIRPEAVYEKIIRINPSVKVVVTSIYNHDGNPADAAWHRTVGFLKKPFRMADLLGMLEKIQENP